MNDLTADEAEALIALVSQPPPTIDLGAVVERRLVSEFLRSHEIRPGRVPSIPVSSIYSIFRAWAARVAPEIDPLTPMTFARRLRKLGFQRRFRDQRHHDDRRLLAVNPDAARSLRAMERQSPPSTQDRALFDPRHRRKPT